MALMLAVTRRAGVVAGDVGLVKFMTGMAGKAVPINFRHLPVGNGMETMRLQWAGVGAERGTEPFFHVTVRGRVTGTATITAGPRVFELRKHNAVVMRRHCPRRNKPPPPRAAKADDQHGKSSGCESDAEAPAHRAQRAARTTRRHRAATGAIGTRAVRAGATVILRPSAFPAALLLAFLGDEQRPALAGRAAIAGGRRPDAARAAIARAAAFPILIGPLVAAAVKVGRWQLVLQGDAK